MIFVRLQHEDRPELRAFIVARDDAPATVSHFYLEIKNKAGEWVRSRKLKGERFERMARRLGFDYVEAVFVIEEKLEEIGETE